MTMSQHQLYKKRREEFEKFAKTYVALEKSGHLESGQISESVNWNEIEDFLRDSHIAMIDTEIEALRGMKVDERKEAIFGGIWVAGTHHEKMLVNSALQDRIDQLLKEKELIQNEK